MQTEQDKDWCKVVMVSPGSGMSVFTNDKQAQRVMRVGRKRNDGPVIQTKAEPYYRKFDKHGKR